MADAAHIRATERWEYPRYRIISNHIEWLPAPATSKDVEIYYVRQFVPLENTTDEISPEIPRGWEDFVVAHLAEYLLDKRDLDSTSAAKRKEMARRKIIDSASHRNASGPRKTIDVNRRYDPGRSRKLPYPRT